MSMKKTLLIISMFLIVVGLCFASLHSEPDVRLSFKIFEALSFDFQKTSR